MELADLPVAITATDTVLSGWTRHDPPAISRNHDHVWTRNHETVTVSTFALASGVHTQITYVRGGAELAHLILSSPDQVRPWLRVVGIVEPSAAELAEAVLSS